MLFVIIGQDAPDSSEKRPVYREEHLSRLEELEGQGRLILAGPFTDKSGSLIVIEADNEKEVKEFMDNDPYVLNGVYESVDIKPFKQVFPRS